MFEGHNKDLNVFCVVPRFRLWRDKVTGYLRDKKDENVTNCLVTTGRKAFGSHHHVARNVLGFKQHGVNSTYFFFWAGQSTINTENPTAVDCHGVTTTDELFYSTGVRG
jgi:hypothetical protein